MCGATFFGTNAKSCGEGDLGYSKACCFFKPVSSIESAYRSGTYNIRKTVIGTLKIIYLFIQL